MASRFSLMTAFVGLLTSTAWTSPGRADCAPARKGDTVAAFPPAWRAAVDALIRSASEPGHPWSCPGGSVDLELGPDRGAILRVAREGEPSVARPVAAPEDVVPLGQALLAAPLAPPDAAGHSLDGTATPGASPRPLPVQEAHEESANVVPGAGSPAHKDAPRILLGGGIDARGVGNSGVAWVGPTLSAGVPMGRWLPSISARQQSTVLGDGPPVNELSVAFTLQWRLALRELELRAGLALRGAAVLRDLPRPQGEQSQLQGRFGAMTSFVFPLAPWGKAVIAIDADVVGLSRKTAGPVSTSTEPLRPFPTFTAGGTVGIEVPL